ncbi:transcriptional regulator BetI [Nocardia africana]|uniref:Transcriptional regulator BetI n=1 Tax=Nocardia africana TaxID=134964 RepID=A0A378X048_9NOCA|nr:transcriptional regulator BetI [Nocardia africana]
MLVRQEREIRGSARPLYNSHVERQRVSNRRGRQSRKEILEAAARVMGQRGYAATSLSALSTEIGLAKSVILHHFHTKSGLLSAVMETGMKDFFQALSDPHTNPPVSGTPRERLSWFLNRAAGVLTEREEFLRLHMLLILSEGEDTGDAEVADTIASVRREGRSHVNRMIRESFRDHGPEIAQAIADKFERFCMAGIDGAFLGGQAETGRSMSEEMNELADAIALMAEAFMAKLDAVALDTGSVSNGR